jgi:hypothetical protein
MHFLHLNAPFFGCFAGFETPKIRHRRLTDAHASVCSKLLD